METKVCTKCGIEKPVGEFYKGISSCRVCIKAYNQTPERKAYRKAYKRTPEQKAYKKAYDQTPERKAYMKAYDKTPERKAHKKAYYQTPEQKAYMNAYKQTPEYKAYMNAYMKAYMDTEAYAIYLLTRYTELTKEEIMQYPELIKTQLLTLKTKRLCRTSQN